MAIMDNQLLKFINREVDYVETMCGIGREPLGKGKDFVMISPKELQSEKPLFSFWNTNKSKPTKPIVGENTESVQTNKQRKRRTFYAKVYIAGIKKYPKDKLSYDYAGMCLHLIPFIEWDSGHLVMGRGKNKKIMDRKDIAEALLISDSTVRRFLSKLEELKLIKCENKRYSMIGDLFAKGREVCESSLKKE